MTTGESRLHLILPVAVAFVTIATVLTFALMNAPEMAHRKTFAVLRAAGFTPVETQPVKTGWGQALYSPVALDAKNISEIDGLYIRYHPFYFLLTGHIATLEIVGAQIIGETATDGTMTFSGLWPNPESAPALLRTFDAITFRNASVSVLTENAGGLSVTFDFEGRRRDGKMEFQAHVRSSQKFLEFAMNVNGITDGNRWYADADLEEGKFELPDTDVRGTRMNGTLNFMVAQNEPLKIIGDLRAGGLLLKGLPWQNASASLEITPETARIFAEAESLGTEGVDLILNVVRNDGAPAQISGRMEAERAEDLKRYLLHETVFSRVAGKIKASEAPAGLDFVWEDAQGAVVYRVNDAEGKPGPAARVFLREGP